MITLTCLGDSITDCNHCFSSDNLGNGYVKILAKHLSKEGFDCKIHNRGADGFTVWRLLQRTQSENLSSFSGNDIITILIGINDIGIIENTDRTLQQKQELFNKFQMHYHDLITILTNYTHKIILMEPFIFPCPAIYKTWNSDVRFMSEIIRTLADKFQLPFLPLHQELNTQALRYGYPELTIDGVHLTAFGQQLLAERLYSCITENNYV